ncbi:21473_t:CDS:1, partial [Gigaspora rosea]
VSWELRSEADKAKEVREKEGSCADCKALVRCLLMVKSECSASGGRLDLAKVAME